MKLPPAWTYASRTANDASSSAVQPKTLPPRQRGKTCSPVLPSVRRVVFVVQVPRGVERDDVIAGLKAAGVQSKPYLPAIHLMSFYRERFGHRPGEFPVCEDVAERSLALPFFPAMTEGQVARVAETLGTVLAR